MRADPSKVRPNRRQQAKQIASLDHIKCTWDGYLGEFRVTYDGLTKEREEAVAYYTGDFEDAMGTAEHMSKFRVDELRMAGHSTEVTGKAYTDTIYR